MVFLINMRVFKTILVLILAFTTLVDAVPTSSLRLEHREAQDEASAPVQNTSEAAEIIEGTSTSSTSLPEEDSYDQRQNGTENYRIHVDGLVVVVAPVEALLLAAGGPNAFGDNLISAGNEKPESKPQDAKPTLKPVEDKPANDQKPDQIKSAHKPHLRLVSLLGPLLKRVVAH